MAEPLDGAKIEVLEGLEPVRLRPGMYVGDTGPYGLQVLLCEVLGNAIDQHLMGWANSISVDVTEHGWFTVEDDGKGMDLWDNVNSFRGGLHRIFETMHPTPTLDGHRPHIHVLQTNGLGLGPVNALCERLEVETRCGPADCGAIYERGKLVSHHSLGGSRERGTRIHFRPDREIFGDARLDLTLLRERVRELAYLNKELALRFNGEAFPSNEGLVVWADRLGENALVPGMLFHRRQRTNDLVAEVAVGWMKHGGTPRLRSFVNQQRTEGGSHEHGLLRALEAAHPATPRAVLRSGLVAVVAVEMFEPRFNGPTKAVLHTEEAERALHAASLAALEPHRDQLSAFFRSRSA